MFDDPQVQDQIRDTVNIGIQAATAALSDQYWQPVEVQHVNVGVTTIYVHVFFKTHRRLDEAKTCGQTNILREYVIAMLEARIEGVQRVAIKFDSIQSVERKGGWHNYYK